MSATRDDWWANLSASQRMTLRRSCWKYLGRIIDVPTLNEMTEILGWSELESDVLRLHADWLREARTVTEAQGLEWTLEECRRYDGWTVAPGEVD